MRLFSIEDKDMQLKNFHKGVFTPKWASAAHPSSQVLATITEERGSYQNQKHTLKGLHQEIFSNYISDKNIIIQKYNKNSRSNQKVKKQIIFN